nr:MAG TPA: hypothetical protein [Caudoviricetes sp.]
MSIIRLAIFATDDTSVFPSFKAAILSLSCAHFTKFLDSPRICATF